MAKKKRRKSYESAGSACGQSEYYRPEALPRLSKKDLHRKMIQDAKK